jgi:hypothetical protein
VTDRNSGFAPLLVAPRFNTTTSSPPICGVELAAGCADPGPADGAEDLQPPANTNAAAKVARGIRLLMDSIMVYQKFLPLDKVLARRGFVAPREMLSESEPILRRMDCSPSTCQPRRYATFVSLECSEWLHLLPILSNPARQLAH